MEKKYIIKADINTVYRIEVNAESTEAAKMFTQNYIFENLDNMAEVDTYDLVSIGAVEEETQTEIMSVFNGHNAELVNKINYLYNKDVKQFHLILSALIERDKEECEEFDILSYAEEDDKAHLYLMEVADDNDLETIISFLS